MEEDSIIGNGCLIFTLIGITVGIALIGIVRELAGDIGQNRETLEELQERIELLEESDE